MAANQSMNLTAHNYGKQRVRVFKILDSLPTAGASGGDGGLRRQEIKELESGLAPELVEELERLSLPFTEDGTPSDAEPRIAQAQLVGWLEGLFHGIQTAIYAQQVSARAQFEQMRRALPARQAQAMGQQAAGQRGMPQPSGSPSGDDEGHTQSGMYL